MSFDVRQMNSQTSRNFEDLWRKQLSQQSTYRAELHELHTELLNMKEKSEMKSHLATNMCKVDHIMPSRTVASEPENVLNTLSPGRSPRWILPIELETPNRPTSSSMQSPVGAPVQLGPSPQTREYAPHPPCFVPPAQWGDVHGPHGDEGSELFGGVLIADDQDLPTNPLQAVQQRDELGNTEIPPLQLHQQPLTPARCVNGSLVRPDSAEEEHPSTACRQSVVMHNGPGGGGSPGANSNAASGGGAAGPSGSGGGAPPPPGGPPGSSVPPGGTPPQQTGGAGAPGGTPTTPPGIPQPNRQPEAIG